jgi:predicted metal-dependent phosphoesterase TrpH
MVVNVPHNWDLHCHSRYSDGQLSCTELFDAAVERGVEHLALTDHDTAVGYRDSIEQGWVPDSLTLYPATELSCVWLGRTIHIVGVGMDVYSPDWLKVEADYVNRREKRFQRIVYLLNKAGFTIDEQRIRDIAKPATPARPHIAQYLVETEQVKTLGHVYKRWLGQGKPGDVKQQWPDIADAVAAIVDNGGMAIIAHPHRYKLTWTKTRELLDDFNAAGGQAVEVACIGLHPEKRKFLVAQAQQRGMWISGGSDFHSPKTAWLKLGYFPSWPNEVPLVKDWLMKRHQG